MLIKDVVQHYGGRVEFVSENWGDSRLAERYGIKRYPVVFVNDILLARPDDFGWYGAKGKYTPWKERANHEKFKRDLTRMIDLTLRGQGAPAMSGETRIEEEAEISTIPRLSLQDLEGHRIDTASFEGRIVIVEFWATWCPPCRTTLSWLGKVERRYGDKVVILAVAVESDEREVRDVTKPLDLPLSLIMGSEELVAPFGTLSSVPRMYVFNRQGKTAAIFYGAPPDLHEKVGRLIDSLVR